MANPRIKNVPDALYRTAKRIAFDSDRTVREVVIEALMLLAAKYGRDGEPQSAVAEEVE